MRRMLLVVVVSVLSIAAKCDGILPSPTQPYDCDNPPAVSGLVKVREPIEGRYIVVRKRGAERVLPKALRGHPVSLQQSVREFRTLNAFTVRVEASVAAALAKDASIAYVQQDGHVHTMQVPAARATWGLDRIDQRDLPLDWRYEPDGNGSGVHVFVIDTGLGPHAEWEGRLGEGHSAIAGSGPEDGHGHGTHVAGTIAGATWGVAKQAVLHGVRVLDANGSGSDSDVIAGIDWMISYVEAHPGPAIANLSLGGGAAPAIDDAICRARKAGISIAVAAGNGYGDACEGSPARVKQAMTVGAIDSKDAKADFSDAGQCLDLWAPGVDVESATPSGGSTTMSGTSMASPHVAGVLVLIRGRNPALLPQDADQFLLDLASKDKLSGVSGSPNLLAYARAQ